jgi:hypothetical protein
MTVGSDIIKRVITNKLRMSCDPLNEICPEQYGESADHSTGSGDHKYMYDIAPYTIIWGAGALGMVAFADWIYQEYDVEYNDDNLLFPDRTYTAGVINTDRYDIDWALAAPETVAWNQASNWMYSVYGFGFLVWMLNMGIDNNGGNLHEFFWRVTQAF